MDNVGQESVCEVIEKLCTTDEVKVASGTIVSTVTIWVTPKSEQASAASSPPIKRFC